MTDFLTLCQLLYNLKPSFCEKFCVYYDAWFDILLNNEIFVWPNYILNTKHGFEVDQVLNAVLSKQTRECFVEI